MAAQPRILLIDSYDSFTFNLAALCKRAIPGCEVHIIKNDTLPPSVLFPLLKYFDAAIVGPGPGSPDNPADIGVVRDLWHVEEDLLIPIFGVCLGLQSLAVEFGARIKRLNVVKHGQVSEVIHSGTDIFEGVGPIHAVRYHSLHVEFYENKHLVPLAWADDGEENGRVLMSLKHAHKPFWSVQYHPESVCTSGGGEEVLRNFWRLASSWSAARQRTTLPWIPILQSSVGPSWPLTDSRGAERPDFERVASHVATRILPLSGVDVPRICEMLGVLDEEEGFVMLDSAASPGRFSIIGCLTRTSSRITYSVGESFIRIREGENITFVELGSSDVWTWLSAFMRRRRASGGMPDVPFWGGLVGYLSYELGAHTLTPIPPRSDSRPRHPDVNLVFVERSVVVDTLRKTAYVQSILPGDGKWLQEIVSRLETLTSPPSNVMPSNPCVSRLPQPQAVITLPNRAEYISKIKAAKEWLFSGDSYELCVTAPTRIRAPRSPSAVARGISPSWELYKTLRARNPAPHSAYLRLHPSTLLSSSPERFLSYSRPPESLCQLRPIKGTVRKAPGITRAVAEEMLAGSRKEVAENLMIVDLIRHDLHSVVGEDVHVRQFCKVEEYETVWQLVSVIEGKPTPQTKGKIHADLGFDVLRASLPPGSMTGAPKKRSVEILRDLEGEERGIYSGVLGYADVGGGGDWAVIIRSCFKHDERPGSSASSNGESKTGVESDDPHEEPVDSDGASEARPSEAIFDEWTLGAGGAITALSDPVAEWEEMVTKVESVLRTFNNPVL
ncbi:para-aminobenzoic acid synthetase [Trametes coccinea BRFM310]|uniref:aminodeoxychorismate synthase n=1 Tax=Trametes coccinea (strain BRFM310) TaxID=1353009 RepID=A0A1Y2IFZ6_TRAC3|nr:para-aminobenzoic acid synthetase [Trametes coccinea BRFM310]